MTIANLLKDEHLTNQQIDYIEYLWKSCGDRSMREVAELRLCKLTAKDVYGLEPEMLLMLDYDRYERILRGSSDLITRR